MDPATEQQAPETSEVSLEQAISEQYDAMEADAEEAVEAAEADVEGHGTDTPPEGEEAPQEAAEAAEGDETAEAEDDAPYDEPAPERWPAELKLTYDQLEPGAKKAFMENLYKPMQASYTRRTQEMAQIRERLDPMMKAYEAHEEAFQRAGVSPDQAFRDQIAWAAHFARVGPQQGLRDMQQALGVSGQQEGQQENLDEYLTPTEKALRQDLDNLKAQQQQQLEAARQEEARRQQLAEQQQQLQGVQSEMASFARETTPDGAPLHPHLDELAPAMAGLLRGGMVARQDDYGNPVPMRQQLSQAYEMAANLNPQIQAQRQQQAQQARQAELVAAASRDVPAKAPVGQVDVQAGPITDTISDIYDSLAAGRR
mgnify:CR=1 FL=1